MPNFNALDRPVTGSGTDNDTNRRSTPEVTLRAYRPEDAKDARELNEAGITGGFALEEEDVAPLGNPESRILQRGGQIVVAAAGPQVIRAAKAASF
jgi:hypothetical protein